MKTLLNRFKSPILWVSLIGLIYSTILVPSFPQLPEWSGIVGNIMAIFGIVNNPCDKSKF